MSEQRKINVDLYGGKSLFGGRETPLEASIIWCDKSDECSLYKNDKCLRCRAFMCSEKCMYGYANNVKGYTSRAQKYYDFKKIYTSDEVYSKLNHPYNEKFAIIGDYYWFDFTYVSVKKHNPDDKYQREYCRSPIDGYVIDKDASISISSSVCFIPKNELTIDLLDIILSEKPRALMGGVITEYQDKVVPAIVNQIRKLDTELYEKLCAKDERYKSMQPNYIGKRAYISTLISGSTIEDAHGDRFTIVKDDNMIDTYLVGTIKSGWVPFHAKEAEVKVILSGNETVEVKDNSWCDDNTKFD